MVVVHGRKEGGLYFAINRIVEILWPQTAPDKLSATDCVCVSKLDLFGCSREALSGDWDDMKRSAWERATLEFVGTVPAGLNLFTTPSTL